MSRLAGLWPLAAVAGMATLPSHTVAQEPVRVAVRAATPFEQQVESLARQVLERRQRYTVLTTAKSQLESEIRRAHEDEKRSVFTRRLRNVEAELEMTRTDRERVERELQSLCAAERQPDGYLGVTFNARYEVYLTNERATISRFRGYPDIESVEPGSPAEKGGIERGDRMLSIAGRDLANGNFDMAALLKPGARLPVRVQRGLNVKMLMVNIEPRPVDFEVPCTWVDETVTAALMPTTRVSVFKFSADSVFVMSTDSAVRPRVVLSEAPMAPPPQAGGMIMRYPGSTSGATSWAAGAQIIALTGALGKTIGVDEGLLVIDVARRSAAAQSGLQSGDVIVSAEGQPVRSTLGLRRLMDESASKELRLSVIRMKRPESIVLRW